MRAIDLFSGPGGLSIGMREAGIIPELCVEFNKDAIATYSIHHNDCIHINKNIRSIDFSNYKNKIDIVIGGPPCQPFSLGGLRKGDTDKRNMIPEFIRCLAEVSPEAFVMENVPGLIMKRARPYFDSVLFQLSNLGYKLNWAVLNSADYGVPQKRKRLFILGSKSRFLLFPYPTHGVQTGLPHPNSFDFIKLEKPIGTPPNSPVKYAKLPDLRKSPYAGHIYNGGGRPLAPSGPCHTILASSGGYKTHWVDTQNIAAEYHKHLMNGGTPWEGSVPGARRLTVEECAIIQTFPREMNFAGSKSSQYTQVGDAVPPILAKAVAEAVSTQLGGNSIKRKLIEVEPLPLSYQQALFS
ncbi:MAG: DNA cytosine methyltransferase [Desulfurivibrionaceae bacterium]